MKPSRKQRLKARIGQRGAAMVEGAVVAALWVLFFNLCMWISGVYMSKIESTQIARYQAFYYASHNCEGTVPAYATAKYPASGSNASPDNAPGAGPDDGNGAGGGPNRTQGGTGGGAPDIGTAGGTSTTSWFMAHGKGTSHWEYLRYGTGVDQKSESMVMCGLKNYSGITGFFSFFGGMIGTVLSSI